MRVCVCICVWVGGYVGVRVSMQVCVHACVCACRYVIQGKRLSEAIQLVNSFQQNIEDQ